MSGEKTGGSVDYYTARVRQENTIDGRDGYTVQCLEVIETLGMTFAEGEAFKAIWRSCAARTLGKLKADNDAKYNAEKVVFYGGRMLKAAQVKPAMPYVGPPIGATPVPPAPVPSGICYRPGCPNHAVKYGACHQHQQKEDEATHRDGGGSKFKQNEDGRWMQWGLNSWFFHSDDPKAVPSNLRPLPAYDGH